MRAIRSLLRGTFALVAMVLPPVTLLPVVRLLRAGNVSYPFRIYGFVVGVLVVAALFAMAWWSTREPRVGGNPWAIAASLVNIAVGLYFLRLTHPFRFTDPMLFLLGTGMLGAVVFMRGESGPRPAVAARRRPRLADDRTNPWLDRATTLLFFLAAWKFTGYLLGWGAGHNLPRQSVPLSLALMALAILSTATLHECGHALAGIAFKMKLVRFNVGPLQWQRQEGKWRFSFKLARILGGAVSVVPTNPDPPYWQEICVIVSGPVANLCTGAVCLRAILGAEGTVFESVWLFLALMVSFSALTALYNLFPFRSGDGAYSDGARILQLLTNSPVVELQRTMMGIQTTLIGPRRLKDLDTEALQRAAAKFPQDLWGVHLHLCALQCYHDGARFAEARDALASAEAIYSDCALDLPAQMHSVFVFSHAYLNHDAAAARLWWARMQEKKQERRTVDYWLARTALLWIEGRTGEAEEALQQADEKARQLPPCGAYEFDRYRCALLRQELDQAALAVEDGAMAYGALGATA